MFSKEKEAASSHEIVGEFRRQLAVIKKKPLKCRLATEKFLRGGVWNRKTLGRSDCLPMAIDPSDSMGFLVPDIIWPLKKMHTTH